MWNKAVVCKQLWALAFKKDRLWVKCVNSYYIQSSSMSDVVLPADSTWMLRKILDCRALIDQWSGWEAVTKGGKF